MYRCATSSAETGSSSQAGARSSRSWTISRPSDWIAIQSRSLKKSRHCRRVAAEWGEAAGAAFPVDIEIVAAKRAGLLRDISELLAREGARIAGSRSIEEDAGVRLRYTVEVENIAQLSRILKLARELRGVARAARR